MADFWTGQTANVIPDDGTDGGGYVKPTTFGENFKAAYDADISGNSQQSQRVMFDKVREERDAQIVKLTGQPLPDIGSSAWEDGNASYPTRVEAYKKRVAEAAAKYPDQIFTDDQLPDRVYQRVRDLEGNQQRTAETGGFTGAVGSFTGSTVAAFNPDANPLNVATLPLGWGKTAVQRILADTAIGGVSEAINQFTGVQAWRKEAGLENGNVMALAQIGYASAGGGILSGLGEGIAAGVGRLSGKTLREAQKMRDGKQTTPLENSIIAQAETNLRVQELGQVPEDKLDALASRWLAESNGGTSDERAAVHALQEQIATRQTNPYDATQPGAMSQHEERLQQTIDTMARDNGRVGDAPPVIAPRLESDNFIGKQPTDQIVDVNDLVLNPREFQFKSDTDATGANDTLKKIKSWNPDLAGTITVFQRADGTMEVADGHQRVNLAKRLVADGSEKGIKLRANVLVEGELANSPLGGDFRWTPESARAYAASINMVQGTGTVADAAKVLRFKPEYLAELSNNSLTRDAQGMSKLSDDAFAMAVNNPEVNQSYAGMVGNMIDDPRFHAPVLRQILADRPANMFQAESIIRQMRDEGFDVSVQENLFGTEEVAESLYKQRAEVLDRALKLLREDKKVFGVLSQNTKKIEGAGNKLNTAANFNTLNNLQMALHNVQTLAYRKGDISDALTSAARDAKENRNYGAAARQFAETVREAVARGAFDGDAGGIRPTPVSPSPAASQGPDLVATGGREIEANLGLDTDRLASEAGLSPARAESVDMAGAGGEAGGLGGVTIPADAVHPRKGLSYAEALAEMNARPLTLKEDTREAFDAAPAKRKKLREKIINDLYGKGAAKKERTMDLIIGPPGSGKSSVIASRLVKERGAIEIDSDIIKTKLPEFDDGIGANAVHAESAYMAEDWMEKAIENGDNIVHPMVGRSANKVRSYIDRMNEMGYKVNVFLVDLPSKVSAERVVSRYKSSGRLLPPSYVLSIGDAPKRTFEDVIKKGVNEYAHFDNNVAPGQLPRTVSTNRPDLYGQPSGTGSAGRGDIRPGREQGSGGAGPDTGPAGGKGQTPGFETGLTPEELNREVPVGVDIDPETGEATPRMVTLRELAQMVADDDALVKYSRECAL